MANLKTEDLRVSGLNRKELLEILQGTPAWEEGMEYWTKPELATLVIQYRGSRSPGSIVDHEITRVSRLKKADIQSAVQEAGLEISGRETIGEMLLMYRKHLKGTLPVEADEVVDFGTHKGKTFAELQTKYPDYCVWARDSFHKDPKSCCPGLYRLACWLEGIHPGSQEMPRTEEPPRPSKASGSGSVPKFRGQTPVKLEQPEQGPKVKAKSKATAVKSMARPTFTVPEQGWMPVDLASEVSIPTEEQEDEEDF